MQTIPDYSTHEPPPFEQFAHLCQPPQDFASFGRVVSWTFARDEFGRLNATLGSHRVDVFALIVLCGFVWFLAVLSALYGHWTQAVTPLVMALLLTGTLSRVLFVPGSVGMVAWDNQPPLRHAMHLTLGADGYTMHRLGAFVTERWLNYTRLRETGEFYLVAHQNGLTGLYVPKRAFANADEQARFKEMVTAGLPAARTA